MYNCIICLYDWYAYILEFDRIVILTITFSIFIKKVNKVKEFLKTKTEIIVLGKYELYNNYLLQMANGS